MNEKISVIIPVYNIARFLPACLDSVASQTYRNLDIILVDDGSTDESGKICDSYAASDPRIRVLHKENRGVSQARNDGMRMAEGEFISFIDSDDWVARETYEILLKAAKQYQADCVAGGFVRAREAKKGMRFREDDRPETFTRTAKEAMKMTLLGSSSACNRLFRREVVEGISFPPDRRNEDEVFALHVYERCNRVVYLADMTYFYRVRKNSATHSAFNISKMDCFYNAGDNLEYIRKQVPELSECAECKYIKMMLYCYGNLLLAKCDDRMKEAKRELRSKLRSREVRGMVRGNRYLPLAHKLLYVLCSTLL